MPRGDVEEFEKVFPLVLKRVLPLGIIALIIMFIIIELFIPKPEELDMLIVTIFGIGIFFGIYAKRYAEKLLHEQKFEE